MTGAPLLHRALERAEEHLASLGTRPVAARASYEDVLRALDRPLQAAPRAGEEVVDELVGTAEPGLAAIGSGRFFGFVMGGALPSAAAADLLVTAWDQNTGLNRVTPATAALEAVAGRWVLECLGLPGASTVGFTTGATTANLVGLAAARHAVLARVGWDVERHGLQGAPPLRVVASEERHLSVDLALRYLGLGSGTVVEVPTDAQSRMRMDLLADLLGRGEGPAVVVLAAGNVNSGAVDDLARGVDVAHAHGAWVHVDGAFGLWAAASRSHRHLVAGGERADSWAVDAHKWLNVPYDCGIAVVRSAADHRAAMGGSGAYLPPSGTDPDPYDLVPEMSRRARGVPVWAALASLGRDGVEDLVDRCCAHARRFAERLAAEPGVAVLNDVVLNQVLVHVDDDATTRAVVAAVAREGTAFTSPSVWKGRAVMRISVSGWRTTVADVDASVDAVLRAVQEVRQPSRQGALQA